MASPSKVGSKDGGGKGALRSQLRDERKRWIESGLWPDRLVHHEWGLRKTFLAVIFRDHPMVSVFSHRGRYCNEPARLALLFLTAQLSCSWLLAVAAVLLIGNGEDQPPGFWLGATLAVAAKVPTWISAAATMRALPRASLRFQVARSPGEMPPSLYEIRRGWRRQRRVAVAVSLTLIAGALVGAAVLFVGAAAVGGASVEQAVRTWAVLLCHLLVSIPVVAALAVTAIVHLSVHVARMDVIMVLFPGLADFRTVHRHSETTLAGKPSKEDSSTGVPASPLTSPAAAAAVRRSEGYGLPAVAATEGEQRRRPSKLSQVLPAGS
jgi:hypothetical protein